MRTLTRRTALAGLASTAVATTAAVPALAETDPLVALGAQAAAARAAAQAASDAAWELEQRLTEDGTLQGPGVCVDAWRHEVIGERRPVYANSVEEIRALLRSPRVTAAKMAELLARLEAANVQYERVRRESGLAELEARSKAAWSALTEIEVRIRDTAATSVAGVAVKLAVARDHWESEVDAPFEDLDFDEQCVVSALRDLERLGGAA